ncbi:MAG: AAA family ATPase [Planctomycetota bacterium]
MPDDTQPTSGPSPEQIAERAERFRTDFTALRSQIGEVIVGQDTVVEGVLTALFADGHALLEGVPGIGKTLLVRTLSDATSLDFGRVQFTPDLMPADITGTTVVREEHDPSGNTSRAFVFEPGPVFCQILLADEINRATPKTQSALLEAMAERRVTAGGSTHPLPDPFFVLATQNPIEQEGTYPLPEAQLDRFMLKLIVRMPRREELTEILGRTTGRVNKDASAVLDAEQLRAHRELVRGVASAPEITDYAVRAVLATHPAGVESDGRFATPMASRYVRLGASPRAAQSIVLAGKVRALLDGRTALSIDDIRWAALPALRHRLVLNFDAQADGIEPDAIVENLIETLPREAPA